MYVTYIFSKYTWVVYLKEKRGIVTKKKKNVDKTIKKTKRK